jgi:hypothetical protein
MSQFSAATCLEARGSNQIFPGLAAPVKRYHVDSSTRTDAIRKKLVSLASQIAQRSRSSTFRDGVRSVLCL